MKDRAYYREVIISKKELIDFCLATGNIKIDDLENQDYLMKYRSYDGSLVFKIWFEDKEEFLNSMKGEKDD